MTGSAANLKHARNEIRHINLDDNEVSCVATAKHRCHDSTTSPDLAHKLNKILESVEVLRKENIVTNATLYVLSVWFCNRGSHAKSTVCCMLQENHCGCKTCIEQWLNEKLNWPHCSTQSTDSFYDVHGFDDFLKSLLFFNDPSSSNTTSDVLAVPPAPEVISDDDDFELPRFTLR